MAIVIGYIENVAGQANSPKASALDILKERNASGELQRKEYLAMKTEIAN